MRELKALANLNICTVSPEHLLLNNAISTKILCAPLKLRVLGLEYGVLGMKFNSKFGFHKQE